MDPVGKQKKVGSSGYHQGFQKLLSGGGSKKSYSGTLGGRSTRAADAQGRAEGKFQGTVKGRTKHTFKG